MLLNFNSELFDSEMLNPFKNPGKSAHWPRNTFDKTSDSEFRELIIIIIYKATLASPTDVAASLSDYYTIIIIIIEVI